MLRKCQHSVVPVAFARVRSTIIADKRYIVASVSVDEVKGSLIDRHLVISDDSERNHFALMAYRVLLIDELGQAVGFIVSKVLPWSYCLTGHQLGRSDTDR